MPHLSLPRSQSIARVLIMRFGGRLLGWVLQAYRETALKTDRDCRADP
jgi:hypothetical protein